MRDLMCLALLSLCLAVSAQQCLPDYERIDCWPGPDPTEPSCRARGCTWCEADIKDRNVPECYLPESYGYAIDGDVEDTPTGFRLALRRNTNISYFGNDSPNLNFEVEFQSNSRLRIKITDGTPRFEVPLEVSPGSGGNANPLYDVQITNGSVFSFKVVRKSTGAVLFDTSIGGLTFSNQFLQIVTRLPSTNLYGIGENEQVSFRHNFDKFYNWPLYSRDQPPEFNLNMYGVHPRYTVLESDGSAHGVLILNSNAQEFVTIPSPGLLYRTIGGILDLHFFLGPTPENVVEQYTEAIGRAPVPPYWALGFQLSNYGYRKLEDMKAAVDRTRAAKIPQDVQYGDVLTMDRALDFTISTNFSGLPDYVKELKAQGVKFVEMLDPCISIGEPRGTYRPFELGNEMDVWIKKEDGRTPVTGRVWPEDPIYFPDYSKNSTREWWIILIKEFKDLLDYDGIWIDMNEPVNFVDGDMYDGCEQNLINNPPYIPGIAGGNLANKTTCPDHQTSKGLHYNTHSLFGWFMSEPTQAGILEAIPGKRTFVLSRSTFVGSGKWALHWLGDNWSSWSNLHFSIIGILQFNHFGIPFVGADICGFLEITTAPMCQRWQELGAFYPYSRNHNSGWEDQDPAVWGPEIAESSRKALEIRYTILPYLYSLFHLHATRGTTVARALWHEFPIDQTAAGIDTQFLLGPGFLVSAVLEEGQTSRQAYFPDARWFDYRSGTETFYRGRSVTLSAPMDYIPLHLRGGIIYPTQEPALNTVLSRQNPFGIIVAPDENNRSEGFLYYDDGESLDSYESGKYYLARYTYENGNLETIVEHDGYPSMAKLKYQTVRLMGTNASRAFVNGQEIHMTKSASGEVLLSNLNLSASKPFQIKFR